MKYIFGVILFLSVQIFPQNIFITGKVKDSQNKSPLSSANVLLYHLPDSIMKGTTTNEEGIFKIENLKAGEYALVIKYLGYQNFRQKISIDGKSVDLETNKFISGQHSAW